MKFKEGDKVVFPNMPQLSPCKITGIKPFYKEIAYLLEVHRDGVPKIEWDYETALEHEFVHNSPLNQALK